MKKAGFSHDPGKQSDDMVMSRSVDHESGPGGNSGFLFPIIILVAVTVLAFANAVPDALVYDDKFFVGPDRASGLDDIKRIFADDVWNEADPSDGLYRPLLLLSFSLESRLFGSWLAGYHLSNILLHLMATLLSYGFFRQLLSLNGRHSSTSDLGALLAAMVFAVHPIHTEVVNSIFNRSAMMVAIAGMGGLWWLLRYIDSRPARAWFGFAVAYVLALFSKESAVVLPGLAVALIVLLSPESYPSRIRKCLPVFWLLIPLIFYMFVRANVLAPPEMSSTAKIDVVHEQVSTKKSAREVDLLKVATVLGKSIKIMAWPHSLRIYHEAPTRPVQMALLALQLTLIVASLILLIRGHSGMAAGLAFYYVAMLPASRIHNFGGVDPHVAERYLYLPSVGLAIILLFGFRSLALRFGPRFVVVLGGAALMVLTALTWDRNYDWSSDVLLFESEYRQNRGALEGLVSAHMSNKNYVRVADLCDENQGALEDEHELLISCAQSYGKLGQVGKEEQALLSLINFPSIEAEALMILAKFYAREARLSEAQPYFERAVELSPDPAEKAFRIAEMLVYLYPGNREKLREARVFYVEALRLRPGWEKANRRLMSLDRIFEVNPDQKQ